MTGLSAGEIKGLEELYRRRMPATEAITADFAGRLSRISEELNRVVAVLVDRQGEVEEVMLGDAERVYLPDIGRQRGGAGRFRGLRLIRTAPTEGG
ncbi:MAG: GTPase HflX, partial [Bradymonadaceae bacterium]